MKKKMMLQAVIFLVILHKLFCVEFKDFVTRSGIDLVAIDGGAFDMGCNDKEDQKPVHKVSVDSFYISKYEVTQYQFSKIMGYKPQIWSENLGNDRPVCFINWYEAVEFCNKLSEFEGLEQCYIIVKDREDPFNQCNGDLFKYIVRCDFEKNGYRLPTEAEWEYAAKGGNKSEKFIFSGSDNIDDVAWCNNNSTASGFTSVKKIGTKKANELGIYDMSGNASEFCWDWYDPEFYSVSPDKNPKGPKKGSIGRVMRGGSCNYPEMLSRNCFRSIWEKNWKLIYGIRLAKSK